MSAAESVAYDRQLQMFNPQDHANARIVIAGLGNIGSHTALALARMGLRHFVLYDWDTVEAHNLASQAYTVADLGRLKVEAIADHMRALNPAARIEARAEAYCGGENCTILVSAVDSLEARREIAAGTEGAGYAPFVVDGRMGGGQVEVHAQPAHEWAATIPESASDDPCGARYISYTSYIIAGLVADVVKRHLQGESVPRRILGHADTFELIVTR